MSAVRALERRDWLVVLGVALIGLVAILVGWWTAEFRVRDAVRSYALSVAERVTEAAADILDPNGPETVYANDREAHAVALELLQRTSGVLRMVAYDRNSVVWLDSTGAALGRRYDQEDVAEVFATGEPLTMLHMTGGEYHVLGLDEGASATAEIYVPIRRRGAIVGAFELYLDATDTLAAATNIARIAYAVFVVTILLAMIAILVLVWRSLLRRRHDLLAIDALRRNAEAISAELAAVNKRQERFNANAAHELRTPLAILRARLDAMAESDDSRALKRDVDGMIHQVELLLELARTETASVGTDAEIDLAELAQDLAARLYPMARRAGREIAVEAPRHAVIVAGERALMESAVRNLLENALRASPRGATVRLVVEEGPPRLAVADHGPGLDPAELPELTEPFRRGPKGGSAGLGLAIVAEAAKRLKAQLSLARTDEAGGATFSLTFPR
ncbi:MAG TPA: HAMP domain-containing sensor histidine kinase [Dongiaceae bacterium]|jgi:signal transduction histidine kinase|nr:HAMP domain-containing sensor histidine kinase [Dongiaceae bacterium]